jgi:diadenosine tetraphosphatase ApaH/serine/threonine PP2A family protein phosphatase
MRYAIFTDIHANLEALEAVLAKIDELDKQEPIDQIWFLGDLVGYGPNPNECVDMLRARTDVIIAGNHDWAAVGKISLEDFSEAARISAEWTAKQLTDENRDFLINLPERIEKGICTLVHGSPYGPLWEYLTSEILAERSFEYFNSLYCFVGHTHVPVIFQQPDVANTPTIPLADAQQELAGIELTPEDLEPIPEEEDVDDDETQKMVVVRRAAQNNQATASSEDTVHLDPKPHADALNANGAKPSSEGLPEAEELLDDASTEVDDATDLSSKPTEIIAAIPADRTATTASSQNGVSDQVEETPLPQVEVTSEDAIANAEDRLNQEIEELLALLGLSQNTVSISNEMVLPPEEGPWRAPKGYRAIVNPGGVGQPRDGNPKAAFMIFDPAKGFHFYRVPYDIEKTQEKIIEAGLPRYLATRLSYGR